MVGRKIEVGDTILVALVLRVETPNRPAEHRAFMVEGTVTDVLPAVEDGASYMRRVERLEYSVLACPKNAPPVYQPGQTNDYGEVHQFIAADSDAIKIVEHASFDIQQSIDRLKNLQMA